MNHPDTDTADEIADEVAQIAQTAMLAVARICRAARDPACAEAARLALGIALLGESMTTAQAVETVNDAWRGRWRIVPVH